MAEKTEKNPRGAGRKKKAESEKAFYFTVSASRPVVEAITALARKEGLTRGLYIQRLLEVEAAKYSDEEKQGRLLGELYAVALEVEKASRGFVAQIEALRNKALDRPSAAFPEILEFCGRELPRVTLANGRERLKTRVADLTTSLRFTFPETLTAVEREAFETAVEKYFKK
ncbi:MAG: hypothetical protein J6K25_15805 [Thermoguttaceae bacterium]|nr:hypothetical protein [Thermoguttaceae bacterium]MBP3532620.1 hypothetical protein [Thermoguttaceae bacterium]